MSYRARDWVRTTRAVTFRPAVLIETDPAGEIVGDVFAEQAARFRRRRKYRSIFRKADRIREMTRAERAARTREQRRLERGAWFNRYT